MMLHSEGNMGALCYSTSDINAGILFENLVETYACSQNMEVNGTRLILLFRLFQRHNFKECKKYRYGA
jgi:hypothetical protein